MTSTERNRLLYIFAALIVFATKPAAAAKQVTVDATAAEQAAEVAATQQTEEAVAAAEAAKRQAATAKAAAAQAEAALMRAQLAQRQTTRETLDFLGSDPSVEPVVTGAPYSAEGVTTVTQTLGDGTRIKRSVTSKFYRDGAGRVRREQTILGLAAVNPSSDSQPFVIISDPVKGMTSVLNPRTHMARQTPVNSFGRSGPLVRPPPPPRQSGPGARPAPSSGFPAFPGPPLAPPPGGDVGPAPSNALVPAGKEESLGTRQIEGVTASGHRSRITIPVGQIGNDRPLEITDEQWESADLKVVILSRHHDPRTGDTEYRLTQISRVEPPPDLFAVPSDYTIVDAAVPRRPLAPPPPVRRQPVAPPPARP